MPVFLRADWGSTIAQPAGYLIDGPVQEAYVHHYDSGIKPERSLDTAKARVRSAQTYHAYTQGWGDIGYSWLVDDLGNIFEGRGWWRTGAHTYGFNSKGYAVCWLGDSMHTHPSDAAVAAIAEVIRTGIEIGALVRNPTIVAHRDRVPDTSCCGTELYGQLEKIRALVAGAKVFLPPTPTLPPIPEDDDMRFAAIRIPNGQVFVEDLLTGTRHDLLAVMPQGTDSSAAMAALAQLVASGIVKGGANGAAYTGLGWEANWALDQLDNIAQTDTGDGGVASLAQQVQAMVAVVQQSQQGIAQLAQAVHALGTQVAQNAGKGGGGVSVEMPSADDLIAALLRQLRPSTPTPPPPASGDSLQAA